MAALLLTEPTFEAAISRIGIALRAAGGASKAADMIEGFLKAKQAVVKQKLIKITFMH
jgi:hypothetical protein